MNAEQFEQAVEIRGEINDIRKVVRGKEHEIQMLRNQIEEIRKKCPHAVTRSQGDPATGRSEEQCQVCEKWL